MSATREVLRHRLIVVSRTLWIPGLVVAGLHFYFNLYIDLTSNYCCDVPWSNFDWVSLIVIFVCAMVVTLVGLILRRIVARPSLPEHALWLAAGIGWCGVLLFGIGSPGQGLYDDTGSGGGLLSFYMMGFGILTILLAGCILLGGVAGLLADIGSTQPPRRT